MGKIQGAQLSVQVGILIVLMCALVQLWEISEKISYTNAYLSNIYDKVSK